MEYLYILRSFGRDRTLLKFGFTKNIVTRFMSYKSANPFIEIVHVFKIDNARLLEGDFHSKNVSYVGKEWYEESYLNQITEFVLQNKGIDITQEYLDSKPIRIVKTIKTKTVKRDIYFKEIVENYESYSENIKNKINEKYDFLEDAIVYLGYDKIKKLKYNTTNIKRYIDKAKHETLYEKIKAELKLDYRITNGVYVTSNQLSEEIFPNCYKNIGIEKKCKASDIERYFKVKLTTRRNPYTKKTEAAYYIITI